MRRRGARSGWNEALWVDGPPEGGPFRLCLARVCRIRSRANSGVGSGEFFSVGSWSGWLVGAEVDRYGLVAVDLEVVVDQVKLGDLEEGARGRVRERRVEVGAGLVGEVVEEGAVAVDDGRRSDGPRCGRWGWSRASRAGCPAVPSSG